MRRVEETAVSAGPPTTTFNLIKLIELCKSNLIGKNCKLNNSNIWQTGVRADRRTDRRPEAAAANLIDWKGFRQENELNSYMSKERTAFKMRQMPQKLFLLLKGGPETGNSKIKA